MGLQFLLPKAASLRRCWIVAVAFTALSTFPVILFLPASTVPTLLEDLARILDGALLLILAATIYRLSRDRARALRLLTASLSLFWLATAFHLLSGERISFPISSMQLMFWNLEQLAFSTALFLLALAIGEMSTNLFDIVFIRIHVVFILVASLIILVVTRTEQSEYLTELRSRSQNLAAFALSSLESSAARGLSLQSALNRQDLLARITTDFGNLPELAAVQIQAGNEVGTLEISAKGEIRKNVSAALPKHWTQFEDQDRYLLIASHSLNRRESASGNLRLYGLKDYIDRYARRRTALIFTLFTAGVGLATLMIGLVTYHAERRLQRQKEELQKRQEELAMASKLAMLGELAGSVAHEINTPATTSLSRALLRYC